MRCQKSRTTARAQRGTIRAPVVTHVDKRPTQWCWDRIAMLTARIESLTEDPMKTRIAEVLAVLALACLLLDTGYATVPLGRDLENNRIYIWPYFAEVPLGKLSPAQQVELLRLVPPATAKEMMGTGKYTYWRLAIGADGTWHSFRK